MQAISLVFDCVFALDKPHGILMGCGPSWPASRRFWDSTDHEESTQLTAVLDSRRASATPSVQRPRLSSQPSVAMTGVLGRSCKESTDMKASRTYMDGFKGARKRTCAGDNTAHVTFNTFSSTKAVYIRGDSRTSTITVRLSADCSTLQIEQVEMTHGANHIKTGNEQDASIDKTGIDTFLLPDVRDGTPRRSISEPILCSNSENPEQYKCHRQSQSSDTDDSDSSVVENICHIQSVPDYVPVNHSIAG